jgi:hypothetical protein
VHHDTDAKLTKEQYEGFLVESPLLPVQREGPAAAEHEAAAAAPDDAAPVDPTLAAMASALGASVELLQAAKRFSGGLEAAAALVQQALPSMGEEALLAALGGTSEGGDKAGGGAELRQAVRDGLSAQAAAWREGEGAGASLPLLAHTAHAGADTGADGDGEETAMPGFAAGAVAGGIGGAAGEGATDMSLGYGSFHHKYYLDDRLIAVGVVDVLPVCVSSVYVFYDPDLPRLQLGRYTALREIQWVQRAMRVCPRLRYYYMGFYIHSCQKMRYKAEYSPSELLCPVTGHWVTHADAKPILDVARFARLARSPEERDAFVAAHAPSEAAGAKASPKKKKKPSKPKKGKAKLPAKAAASSAAGGGSGDGLTTVQRLASVAEELPPVPAAAKAEALALARTRPLLLVRSETVCRSSDLQGKGPQLVDDAVTELALRTSPEFTKRCLVYF